MERVIVCETCGAKIGTLKKEVITDQDIVEYYNSVVCDNGHPGAGLVEQAPYPDEESSEEPEEA